MLVKVVSVNLVWSAKSVNLLAGTLIVISNYMGPFVNGYSWKLTPFLRPDITLHLVEFSRTI